MQLTQFIGTALGGAVAALIGFLAVLFWEKRKFKQEKEKRRKLVLSALSNELKDNLAMAKEDPQVQGRKKAEIPFEFTTHMWQTYCGEIDLPPDTLEKSRSAYIALNTANAYGEYTRAILVFQQPGESGKYMYFQKYYVEQHCVPRIEEALNVLSTEVE